MQISDIYGTRKASPRLELCVLWTQVAELLHLFVVNLQQFPEDVYTFSSVMTSIACVEQCGAIGLQLRNWISDIIVMCRNSYKFFGRNSDNSIIEFEKYL